MLTLATRPSTVSSMNPVSRNKSSLSIMNDLQNRLNLKEELLPIHAKLKLTKTSAHETEALLLRDFTLENQGRVWLESRVSFDTLMKRYRNYDAALSCENWPQHYPVRVLSGNGAIASGKNIFLFFPEVLGSVSEKSDETFGFELVDVWRNIFEKNVIPSFSRNFDRESQLLILRQFLPLLDETIFIASVLHEVGHRVGPFAISPKTKGEIGISDFQLDIAGELSTDSLFASLARETPELSVFLILQRIFWFGRRGYSDKPMTGWINSDNDSWISVFLWQRLRFSGLIEPSQIESGKWALRLNTTEKMLRLPDFFSLIVKELDEVGAESEADFQSWMDSWVEKSDDGEYLLPQELRRVFENCSDIPEFPLFVPFLR